MFRLLSTLITVGTLGYGAWWLHDTQPHLKDVLLKNLPTSSAMAFEARFTPKQIAQKEKLSLPKDTGLGNFAPLVQLYPYLLMNVKFINNKKETEEGVLLWDLLCGEMVLSTRFWETTHGFADCMNAKASAYEYTLIKTILEQNGKADQQTLINCLPIDPQLARTWIKRCCQKKLIIQQNASYRVHLQNPTFHRLPATEITTPLITKPQKCQKKLSRRYCPAQIKKASQAAFGPDFAIRNAQEVFLPVYEIKTVQSDGLLTTTFWNALSGKRLQHHLSCIEPCDK